MNVDQHAEIELMNYAEKVQAMRAAQKKYFQARKENSLSQDQLQQLLIDSKQKEANVDKQTESILSGGRVKQELNKFKPVTKDTEDLI
jgi:hypothetical protein